MKKVKCINGGFVDHTCKCVCPDNKRCTVSNTINEPYPVVETKETTPAMKGKKHAGIYRF